MNANHYYVERRSATRPPEPEKPDAYTDAVVTVISGILVALSAVLVTVYVVGVL